MNPIRLLLVGGFLGAGKTTLLAHAGSLLRERGKRVGLITNDQAEGLVDTELLRSHGFDVEEIGGGCFCCRFSELMTSSTRLIDTHRPDVLIGEPVGSCTDLAATVLRPMQEFFSDRFEVAAYTVVVDPQRLRDLMEADSARNPLSDKVLYIYSKQLEEADIILLNKVDQLADDERDSMLDAIRKTFPCANVIPVSALNGTGLDHWLDQLENATAVGGRIASVDYDIYAEGEARLGWLNASLHLKSSRPMAWKPFCMELLKELKDRFLQVNAEIAHVKLSLTAPGNALIGNLTSSRGHPFLYVQGTAEQPAEEGFLILNARVEMDPEGLKQAATAALEKIAHMHGLNFELQRLQHFSPARPEPEHRIVKQEDCLLGAKDLCSAIRTMFKPKRA